jgi:hypothetical protein
MRFHNFLWILATLLLLSPAGATYTGDRPLETVFTDDLHGGYWYSMGNSTYAGSLPHSDAWHVGFSPEIPPCAEVRYQRLYVYWTWSRLGQEPVYPELEVTWGNRTPLPLSREARYLDHKGFAGTNDFYTGMDSYQVPPIIAGEPCTITVVNSARDNRTISLYGAALLAVWEEPGAPLRSIWVKEGADLLYSSYGISPEMATSPLVFDGTVAPLREISSATIFLVAPSGGYSRENIPGRNALLVNCIPDDRLPSSFSDIFSLMFPGYKGKVWMDIFEGDEMHQIGTEEKEITRYLRPDINRAEIRDQGDYLLLTNAVLEVTRLQEGTG